MKVEVKRWGIGLTIDGFVADLYLGDVYLRIPGICELAWNATGFFFDRGTVAKQA